MYDSKDEVEKVLAGKNQSKKLDNIDWALLKILIDILKPFVTATKELEGTINPTNHKVIQCVTMLENFLQESPTDTILLKKVEEKSVCMKNLIILVYIILHCSCTPNLNL